MLTVSIFQIWKKTDSKDLKSFSFWNFQKKIGRFPRFEGLYKMCINKSSHLYSCSNPTQVHGWLQVHRSKHSLSLRFQDWYQTCSHMGPSLWRLLSLGACLSLCHTTDAGETRRDRETRTAHTPAHTQTMKHLRHAGLQRHKKLVTDAVCWIVSLVAWTLAF